MDNRSASVTQEILSLRSYAGSQGWDQARVFSYPLLQRAQAQWTSGVPWRELSFKLTWFSFDMFIDFSFVSRFFFMFSIKLCGLTFLKELWMLHLPLPMAWLFRCVCSI